MKGIFVNEDGIMPYANLIIQWTKLVETRNRNMLKRCVGDTVAVIRTKRGNPPTIIGYVRIVKAEWYPQEVVNGKTMRNLTIIPEGSKYDSGPNGKWCYLLRDAEPCKPYILPANATRHGRSWCEW